MHIISNDEGGLLSAAARPADDHPAARPGDLEEEAKHHLHLGGRSGCERTSKKRNIYSSIYGL